MIVDIWVPGHPRPQGSKTPITRGGRTWLIEKSRYLEEWRRAVALKTKAAGAALGDAPVGARIVFYLPRPADHYGTGRNAGVLKAGAPAFPMGKAGPDADKLERAVFDGLAEGGAYDNDSQVVMHASVKLYASAPRGPGCMITLMDVG